MALTPTEHKALRELLLAVSEELHTKEVWLPDTPQNVRLLHRIYTMRYGVDGERHTSDNRGMLNIHTATLLTDWLLYRLGEGVPTYGFKPRNVEPLGSYE